MGLRTLSVLATSLAGLAGALAGAPAPPVLSTLQPGGFRDIQQTLGINIVFVGFETGLAPHNINEARFIAQLPNTYRSINRIPAFYGIRNFLVSFNYNYNIVYAPRAFEDNFFSYLASIGRPRPPTFYQALYNGQKARSLNVNNNFQIDASSVERWLAANSRVMLGVDTTQYTIFFINWHGRPDFVFHVYSKTDEPDPDTGRNFGLQHARQMIAWGGTAPDDEEGGLGVLGVHRLWFYDLSAGPEAWTSNWNVDDADVDGTGVLDYRMPPVWEYGNVAGYRPFDDLSGDLGKIARYVAIDMLFTTSPLYKPAISPPLLPSNIELDVNFYQGEPAVDAKAFLSPGLVKQEVSELQPLNRFEVEVNSRPLSGRISDVYDCFRTALFDVFGNSCYGFRLFGIAFADFFLYHQDHLNQYLEGDGDYEMPIFVFNVPVERRIGFSFADDNWSDGTQSFIFMTYDPLVRQRGLGLSDVMIHEAGHHLGISHPHDGYDYEQDIDFFQSDRFYFAWSGDESNTVMSYLSLNLDFSQFDRDNMNRFLTSTYINQANSILARIYASPRVSQASSLLIAADTHAAMALKDYSAMNYSGAASEAKQAYLGVVSAAAEINVPVEPQAWPADYRSKGKSSKFIDNVDSYRLDAP